MANTRNNARQQAYRRRRRSQTRRNGNSHARHNRHSRGIPLWVMATIAIGVLGVIAVASAGTAAFIVYDNYAEELLAPDELAINQPSFGAKIYDRHGTLLYEYVDDKAGLRRPIKLEEVSEAFLAATIATEDNSFFTNPGVNIRGLARAAWENVGLSDSDVFGGSGGSSITQQLVKNVYIPEEERVERSVSRKIKETVYAIELTQKYEKERILEWYVNQISYGGVYNGVQAAALGYFGKPASELTLAEAALLAGIPQSPAAYDPVTQPEAAASRRDEVLDLMARQAHIQIGEQKYYDISPEVLEEARIAPIEIQEKRFPIEAPHWVLSYIEPQLRSMLGCKQLGDLQVEVIAGTRDILAGRPGEGCEKLFTQGLVVTTTLDLNLQKQTEAIMEGWIREYEARSNSHNGAMMISDPKTGEILVMVGSRDYNRGDIEGKNNNAISCNSPGSAFKPFAYLTTFEKLGWGPGTMILDTAITIPGGPGEEAFVPRNPSGNFSGPITIRHALGNSLNIPPVKAAAAVGAQSIVEEARKVGFVDTFRSITRDGCSRGGYGPAIATGGVDVTLDEMMFGYTVLANGGIMRGQEPVVEHDSDERKSDPVSILKIEDNKGEVLWDIAEKRREMRVVDAAYTYLLWDILTDPQAQCATFTCGAITIPGYKAAVKTGTSEPYATGQRCAGRIGETWAFGYSPDLVVGIWAGNSNNDCVTDIVSTSIAFRAMRDAFTNAHAGKGVTQMPRPENVAEAEVCMPSGMKATELCGRKTKDLFVKDKLPQEDDTWWQKVRLDVRNGKLAAPNTPAQFVEERVMLVIPENADRKSAEEWAKALNLEVAPTEISDGSVVNAGPEGAAGDPNAPAAIYSPLAGRRLLNQVSVVGRATSPDFEKYVLEYGKGENPQDWTQIIELTHAQNGGTIGIWDVSGLEDGTYTLRLTVLDRRRGPSTASVVVVVGNAPAGTPAPTSTPRR